MSRTHNEDNSAFNQHFQSGRFSHSRRVLTANVVLTVNGSLVNFFDPNGADKDVTLPALEEGRFYVVGNVGTANTLNVKNASGTLITACLASDTALIFASDTEWMALRGWAALGVFTNTVNGLVPAPNSGVPGSLFLRDDGQWGQVQVTGIVDAFKYITDGTNTAIGAGPDTFRLRSSTSKVAITVTNNEAVFGDNANFSVAEAFVDHDALLNFVADKHVAHTGVTLTAGLGISGGGDISVSRTFAFDPSELTVNATPVLSDYAVMDLAAGGPRRTLWSSLNAILDHNALLNYSANRHIDHTGVSIVTAVGSGIKGGGDISASRTLSLDFDALTLDAVPAVTDILAFYDVSEVAYNKFTITNLNAVLDHNALVNYVADQHVAHAGVTLTAGAGLTGGGDISASRTFTVGAGVGITVNADDVALNIDGLVVDIPVTGDFFPFYDISGFDHNKVSLANLNAALAHSSLSGYVANEHINHTSVTLTAGSGLTGGGDISANRTFTVGAGVGIAVNVDDVAIDINGLLADTPVSGDFFPFYDISGADHNKVTLANLTLAIDHNALLNYVADQHVAHTGVSISTTEGIQGGGTIAATRTLKLDINGLTVDAAPDTATDYLATYDTSAALHKKVLLSSLPAGGGSVLYNAAQSLTAAEQAQARSNINVGVSLFTNRIINPSGQIWQRQNTGASAVTDDVYAFDRWYGLTQTAGVTASQVANAENTTPYMMRLTQPAAAAQRFGVAQIIESANSIDLRGQAVTLSARVRMSAATTLRYAILEWTGTADTVTSDWVLSWTSAIFTAGNFFTTTSTTVTSTGSTALTANTLTSISLAGTISSSATNVAVIFWTDSTQAQNVTLDVGKVQLELGATATQYAFRSFLDELMLCRRYYEKSYNLDVAPGTNGAGGSTLFIIATNSIVNGTDYGTVRLIAKLATPTVTIYGFAGTSGVVSNRGGTDLAASSGSTAGVGQNSFVGRSAASTTTTDLVILFQWTAVSEL